MHVNADDWEKNSHTSFSCRYNAITGSLSDLCMQNIKSISLCHNRLTALFSDSQKKLSELELLQSSNNCIVKLNLDCCSKLRKLDASSNQLQMVIGLSQSVPELQYLDLSGNLLADLSFIEASFYVSQHIYICVKASNNPGSKDR